MDDARTDFLGNPPPDARARAARFPGTLRRGGLATGFALGGFFDGIVLHQILQWHHLLSGIEARASDLRFQMLADGLFHALMYLVGGLGLWLLWRARGALPAAGAGRRLAADALFGFAAWHAVDAVLSHWVLGIHRIRMDADWPLLWDLGWLAVFGGGAALAGGALLRGRGGLHGRAAAMGLAAAALLGGIGAGLPPGDAAVRVAVFAPGVSTAEALGLLVAADGRVVWVDASEAVWGVALPAGGAAALYARGALLVGGGAAPAGCLGWIRG